MTGMKDPLIGQVVDGKYSLRRLIGGGGMGRVYEAEHLLLNHKVAVKILQTHLLSDEDALRRFRREAITVLQVKHQNAVHLYDFGMWEAKPYIAMEYLDGLTLKDLIKHKGKLTAEHASRLMIQICGPIALAHQLGIVHRDLKPENIIVENLDTSEEKAYVLDFGVAKVLEPKNEQDATQTKAGAVFGSPKYMAPEQIEDRIIDRRTDVYSLGVILYEMLTGLCPFDSDSPVETMYKHIALEVDAPKTVDPAISEDLDRLVVWMLSKSREDRPSGIAEVVSVLERSLEGELSDGSAVLKSARSRFLTLAVGGVVGVALVVLGWQYFSSAYQEVESRVTSAHVPQTPESGSRATTLQDADSVESKESKVDGPAIGKSLTSESNDNQPGESPVEANQDQHELELLYLEQEEQLRDQARELEEVKRREQERLSELELKARDAQNRASRLEQELREKRQAVLVEPKENAQDPLSPSHRQPDYTTASMSTPARQPQGTSQGLVENREVSKPVGIHRDAEKESSPETTRRRFPKQGKRR